MSSLSMSEIQSVQQMVLDSVKTLEKDIGFDKTIIVRSGVNEMLRIMKTQIQENNLLTKELEEKNAELFKTKRRLNNYESKNPIFNNNEHTKNYDPNNWKIAMKRDRDMTRTRRENEGKKTIQVVNRDELQLCEPIKKNIKKYDWLPELKLPDASVNNSFINSNGGGGNNKTHPTPTILSTLERNDGGGGDVVIKKKRGRKVSTIELSNIIGNIPSIQQERTEYFMKLNISDLKKVCKHYHCKGHSKYTKKDVLVNFMIDNIHI